jgi:hypothetical protein
MLDFAKPANTMSSDELYIPIKLTQSNLDQYFSLADKENSWLQQPTNLYNFVDRQSDTLLVTIGDSWTWGADLTPSRLNDYRVQHVFGNVLAELISSDWLNLAIPAQGNFWIASMAQELANIIPRLLYKKIILVCVFTSVGRWFNTKFDVDLDYIDWFSQNISSQCDFDKLLVTLNQTCVNRILHSIKLFDHVELKIGTNFVDHLGFDNLNQHQLLPLPWYQVIGLQDIGPVHTCVYHDRLSTAINFINPVHHDAFKHWFLEINCKSDRRLGVIASSKKFKNYHLRGQSNNT